MTTTQALALERLIIALEGSSTRDALAAASALSGVPGRTDLYLDALAALDDATLRQLARDGRLLELANAPSALSSIIADPRTARVALARLRPDER